MGKKILFLVIIVFLVISGCYLYINITENKYNKYYLNNVINTSSVNNLEQTSKKIDNSFYLDKINALRAKYNNDEVVGILEIENTDYVVPIMQADDNDYYLNHTPDGESNFMGSIYLDYRVDIDLSKKLLIYGHNSSIIDMPFKILEEFYDKDYYYNHKYIKIITSKQEKKYEIFSVFVETNDFSYMEVDFANKEDFFNHINDLKTKSFYDTKVTLTEDDEILILQTCSTLSEYSDSQRKYLLINLRRVK